MDAHEQLLFLEDDEPDPSIRYLPKILNGGIAGIVGVSCVFPMDLVKTRLQNQQGSQVYSGIIDCFKKTYAEGPRKFPIANLYQGASVNVFLVTPEKAIKLVANDFFRNLLLKQDVERLSIPRGILAGAGAGLCQVVITTPMELLKIRMQQSKRQLSATGLVRTLFEDGGIRALYKGLTPTLMRDVTFSALYFPMFAALDNLGPRKKDGSGDAVFWSSFLAGLTSGATASFCVTPLDVVKTRLQAQDNKYNSIGDAYSVIFRTEGIRAFFKGAVCRMMVMAPLFGIAQTVYYIGVAERILGMGKSTRV